MALKAFNVGGGRHSEAALSALLSQLLDTGDIAKGLNIEPTGSAGLSVQVTTGTGQVRVSQFYSRIVQNDSPIITTPVTAPTSNPRRNLVVLYIDPTVTPTTAVIDNTNDIVKIAVIPGTEASTPQIPSDSVVTATVGTQNWIPLGDFRTAVGQTSISAAHITDQRRMILVKSHNIDLASYYAFRAIASTNQSIPDASFTKVNFSGVEYNYGNHYSSSSMTFTAPVDGLYHFEASVCFAPTSRYIARFCTDTTVRNRFIDAISSSNHTNTASGSLDIRLNAGSKVWIEGWKASGAGLDSLNTNSTFSGRFIAK